MVKWKCLICEKPCPDYEPEFCCNGYDCDCRGQPLHPCVCSSRCEDALYEWIGLPFEERRIKAGIEKWSESDD